MIEKLYIYNKRKGRYDYWGRIPVDDLDAVKPGNTLILKSKKGHERRYTVSFIQHEILVNENDSVGRMTNHIYYAKIFVQR